MANPTLFPLWKARKPQDAPCNDPVLQRAKRMFLDNPTEENQAVFLQLARTRHEQFAQKRGWL